VTLLPRHLELQQHAGTQEALVEYCQGTIRHPGEQIFGIEHFVLAIDPEHRIANQVGGKARQREKAYLRIARYQAVGMGLHAKMLAVFYAVAGAQGTAVHRITGKATPGLPSLVPLIPARCAHRKQLG
jgi:hypothetical protein